MEWNSTHDLSEGSEEASVQTMNAQAGHVLRIKAVTVFSGELIHLKQR